MPSPHEAQPESALRELANLVAESRELARRLDALAIEPGAAPFLFRQLGQSLAVLDASVRAARERVQGGAQPSGGFLGRLKRSLRGGSRREEEKCDEGLQGNSWTIAIPELIGFLSNTRKTGALWVHAPGETFLLQMREGVLVHATSDSTPEGERLGELLVENGALTADELKAFLDQMQAPGMIGIALFREKRIREEDLIEALTNQVQRLFHRMLNAGHCVFRFQEGAQLLAEHHVRLNVMQLLLETARTFDERTKDRTRAAAAAAGELEALIEAASAPRGELERAEPAVPRAGADGGAKEAAGADAEEGAREGEEEPALGRSAE